MIPPVDPLEHLDEGADSPQHDSDGLCLVQELPSSALAVGEVRTAVRRRVADPS